MGRSKKCRICLVRSPKGQGVAMFTAECSHSFHLNCVSTYVANGNNACPKCAAKWKDLPFANPKPNNANSTNNVPSSQKSELEPNLFSDDDPLPAADKDVKQTSSIQLSIKATPERPAVLASESVSQFPVLVGLKAPLISNDTSSFSRAPIDLVTVLDVSGSMHGSKLELVKRAVQFVIDNLGSSDRLSIVTFSNQAQRILRLTRMTKKGRREAKQAVDKLYAAGGTNIVQGLKKGAQILEERREKNPVSSIIFLSDGNDTCNHGSRFSSRSSSKEPQYLHLLPVSIRPNTLVGYQQQTFPVHAFGFGSDHDPIAMHAISDKSGGTFSFIESIEMVQDAFASCIGGLLSVVIQDLRLTARAASHGIEIKSIPSGRYVNNISDDKSEGIINVGDLYAEEEREFLIYLSIPKLLNAETGGKMTILDITCRYKDCVSEVTVDIQADLVEIRRPEFSSPGDNVVNLDVDRQRNRVFVSDSIAEAQKKADSGDLTGAQAVLANGRSILAQSATGQAGDDFCAWLESEIKETEERMGNMNLYEESGRAFAVADRGRRLPRSAAQVAENFWVRHWAFALAGVSAHQSQRAGGPRLLSCTHILSRGRGGARGCRRRGGGGRGTERMPGYETPFMIKMVSMSKQVTKRINEGKSRTSSSHKRLKTSKKE